MHSSKLMLAFNMLGAFNNTTRTLKIINEHNFKYQYVVLQKEETSKLNITISKYNGKQLKHIQKHIC